MGVKGYGLVASLNREISTQVSVKRRSRDCVLYIIKFRGNLWSR